MHWETIRAGGDNLSYLIGDPATRAAAVFDPLNAGELLARLSSGGWKLEKIFLTHGHPDHTGGVPRLLEAASVPVYAHPVERLSETQPLEDGAQVKVGEISVEVIHTPGHTAGGLCYRVAGRLLTGDTVFLAGAGNCRFGGNVGDLYRTFAEKIRPLEPALLLCPGHDYARTNLRFAQSLEPDSPALAAKALEVEAAAGRGLLPSSTLAEEYAYNPFFRCAEPSLKNGLAKAFPDRDLSAPADCFAALRELRNNW